MTLYDAHFLSTGVMNVLWFFDFASGTTLLAPATFSFTRWSASEWHEALAQGTLMLFQTYFVFNQNLSKYVLPLTTEFCESEDEKKKSQALATQT